MGKETTTEMTFQEECESWFILEKVLREGARRMLKQALVW